MDPPTFHLLWLRRTLILAVVSLPLTALGCSLMGGADAQGNRPWSDSMGQGLRGIPDSAPSSAAPVAAQPARKEPLWEKYRDKRVNQINQNLSVEEPTGW